MTDAPPTADPAVGPEFLHRVSPAVRKRLVSARVRAMKGELEAAVATLLESAAVPVGLPPREAVAAGSLAAELLHLDQQDDRAIRVFREVVHPHLSHLDLVERLTARRNWSDLQLLPGHVHVFYNSVDLGRAAGHEWYDADELLAARQAANAGQRYESLPVVWRLLRRAYSQGCWSVCRLAHRYMADECLALGLLDEAAFHTLMARDDKGSDAVVKAALGHRDAAPVRGMVNRLLTVAHLAEHFALACRVLTRTADVVPDDLVPKVVEWVTPRAGATGARFIGPDVVERAWEVLVALAPRLDVHLARQVVGLATEHPYWATKPDNPDAVFLTRRQLIRALTPIVHALPADELDSLAGSVVPLITDRPMGSDYTEAVNLACHLATRSERARERIAADLYPTDRRVPDVLVEVSRHFGREVFSEDDLDGFAARVASNVRRQVQRLADGQQPEAVPGTIMSFTAAVKAGRTTPPVVVTTASLSGLAAVIRHRDRLSAERAVEVVRAVLDLAGDKDNILSNREALLHLLIDWADTPSADVRRLVFDAVEPIARGHIDESDEYAKAAAADNPMNPVKFNQGRPEDVQAMALVVMSEFAGRSRKLNRRASDVLSDAVMSRSPAVRRGAYAAAGRLRGAAEEVVWAVLAATRDPEPAAAATAFVAIAHRPGWLKTRQQWRLFLLALRAAVTSEHVELRRQAATAARRAARGAPAHSAPDLASILSQFAADISYKVRRDDN